MSEKYVFCLFWESEKLFFCFFFKVNHILFAISVSDFLPGSVCSAQLSLDSVKNRL